MTRAHVFVSGRVQGVSFRWHCVEAARRAGVNGWVKNLGDGRVEAVFEGGPEAVEYMVGWCRSGPPSAQVSEVEVERGAAKGEEPFAIRR